VLSCVRESAQGRGSFAAAADALAALARGSGAAEEADEGEDDAPPRLRVTVQHAAVSFCPLGTSSLILPPGSAAAEAPLSPPGRLAARGQLPLPPAAEEEEAGGEASASAALHAHALVALGAALGVRWECFALGPLAAAAARVVASEGEGGARSAALLLVDRTADLLTPALPADSLLSRLLEAPPAPPRAQLRAALRLPERAADAAAPALAGFAAAGAAREAAAAAEAAGGRRVRDGALAARKACLDALRRAGSQPASKPRLGATEPAELRALAAQLAEGDARARAAAAAAGWAAAALEAERAAGPAAAAAAAKALQAAAERGGDALGAAMVALARGVLSPEEAAQPEAAAQGPGGAAAAAAAAAATQLTPSDLRPLLLAGYCLAGELEEGLPEAAERALQAALGPRAAAGAWARLRCAGGARRALRAAAARGARGAAQPLLAPAPPGGPGLLRALAARVAAREELPELLHVPSSLGGLLKSGFGLLGLRGVARPKPGDSPACLVFVLGGLSCGELREAREAGAIAAAAAAAAGEGTQAPLALLLGGTALLDARELAEAVMGPEAG